MTIIQGILAFEAALSPTILALEAALSPTILALEAALSPTISLPSLMKQIIELGVRSSGTLHSFDLWLVANASRQPIGSIVKGQAVKVTKCRFADSLFPRTNRLS